MITTETLKNWLGTLAMALPLAQEAFDILQRWRANMPTAAARELERVPASATADDLIAAIRRADLAVRNEAGQQGIVQNAQSGSATVSSIVGPASAKAGDAINTVGGEPGKARRRS